MTDNVRIRLPMQDRATALTPSIPQEPSELSQVKSTAGLGSTIGRIGLTAFKLLITNKCQTYTFETHSNTIHSYPFNLCLLTLSLTFPGLKMEGSKEELDLCGTPGLTQSSLTSLGTSPLSSLSPEIWFARRQTQ